MTRYKAIISYDGYGFAGFQRQPHARSVQEEIEKTLTRINKGQPVVIHGAGRTDSGVHALGQVLHFDLPEERDEEKLRFALDTQTPEDIDFISVEQVSDDFHSRYNKHSKTYEFLVDIGRPKNPMMRHYATHYPYPLELGLIEEAIAQLEGTHDFTSLYFFGQWFSLQANPQYGRYLAQDWQQAHAGGASSEDFSGERSPSGRTNSWSKRPLSKGDSL